MIWILNKLMYFSPDDMKTINTMFTPLLKENSMKHIDYKVRCKKCINFIFLPRPSIQFKRLQTRPQKLGTTTCSAKWPIRWVPLVLYIITTFWHNLWVFLQSWFDPELFPRICICLQKKTTSACCSILVHCKCTIMQWLSSASRTGLNHQLGSTKFPMNLFVLKSPVLTCIIVVTTRDGSSKLLRW